MFKCLNISLFLGFGRERERLDVERETPDLVREYREGGGRARVRDRLAAHARVEGGRAAPGVGGLYREHLAERVGGAVAKQRPPLHLAEALPAVLRLAA